MMRGRGRPGRCGAGGGRGGVGGSGAAGAHGAVEGGVVTVTTPAHDAGSAAIVVLLEGGTVTDIAPFTYNAAAASASPSSGSAVGGTEITISGAGLGSATGVTFGGTAGTGFAGGG